MTHTSHPSMRRVLRREIAGTIGLLADEHDFTAMRRYRSFAFDDHPTYLRQVETLLRTLAAQGNHTTVALFDPEEYAAFCADTGLEPDTPDSRTRFTAELAATGAAVPYEGQPLAELVPDLIDEAVRLATWEYATTLLAQIGDCASCGEDIGRAAFARATHLLRRILDTAAPGERHLVCSVSAQPQALAAVLHADRNDEGPTRLDESEALEFATVLALGIATRSPGGLVMRTTAPGTTDRVYGWRLRGEGLQPLTAGEVFDAYCTDVESGDLVSPESGVDYCAPPDLGDDAGGGGPARDGHTH
ncbi:MULTISPECIES: hypothetical protein [Streptomyces]|uniref:Uncharacterized protein n=1 Tax=Streptomyces stelliscabiei TaxID=146820 RepID=A0A8I0NXL4_9ACTN|nr:MULTISPECIES: hypothetical protein [Streptomyces]KND43405.1 hypothetical protein IQ64_18875 [Streptomyces stelliscabiei]MBE1595601.1 hypothetical protein [Streptomyces stelliscabiei]MDX2517616.1 hypothetical protein [Streptomyces stelliscabiei]MDX2555430.1 hypothetical protein [Streptomyces stelliscabiei]MDX2613948.1 hypothetical protein [Streptomyces stelliscabiei]